MRPLRLLVCLTLVALLAGACAQAATTAKITAVTLEVFCRNGAGAPWTRARVGTALPSGAQVRTGKRSSCEIRFSDGSMVRLAAQTDLTISAIAGKDMSLGRGKIFSHVTKGTGGATVRGAHGVASIKATTWTNEATGDGFTTAVIEGQVHVQTTIDGQLQDYILGPAEQFASLVGSVQSLLDLPAGAFISQVFMPWYNGIRTGETIGTTGSQLAELEILADNLQEIAQIINQDAGLQNGGVAIDVQSAGHHGRPATVPVLGAMGWVPPEAMLEIPPLTLAQVPPTQTRVLGKRLLGPDMKVDVFGLWGDGPGRSLAGVRVRPRAIWNDLYFEVGATGWTTFEDGWHTVLSEAFVMARPRPGNVTVGRQHFLAGPINNSNLGSLLNFDTADAVRFQPRVGDVNIDVAYVNDFLPFNGPDPSGWYGRAQTEWWRGELAANVVNQDNRGTGLSVDFSFPLEEGKWDLYGEVGCDQNGAHLETWGSYFPSLYQEHDLDLFVEYARHDGADSMLSAYAYKDLAEDWMVLLKLQHTVHDRLSIGVGAVKRF